MTDVRLGLGLEALLSIHARVEGTMPTAWRDPTLVQLWGPRCSTYVVAEREGSRALRAAGGQANSSRSR